MILDNFVHLLVVNNPHGIPWHPMAAHGSPSERAWHPTWLSRSNHIAHVACSKLPRGLPHGLPWTPMWVVMWAATWAAAWAPTSWAPWVLPPEHSREPARVQTVHASGSCHDIPRSSRGVPLAAVGSRGRPWAPMATAMGTHGRPWSPVEYHVGCRGIPRWLPWHTMAAAVGFHRKTQQCISPVNATCII